MGRLHRLGLTLRLKGMGFLSAVTVIGDNPRAARTAAWLANCGCQVHLLGVAAKSTFDLEPIAKSVLYVPEFRSRLKLGLMRDNLEALRKATWIHDCLSANADVKEPLYSVIDTIFAPDAVITTDDTLLPEEAYTANRSPQLAKRFFVIQFAEPLDRPEFAEYALGGQSDPERAQALVAELEDAAGVHCRQARYGVGLNVQRATLLYCMLAINIAERLQLDVDQADRYAEALGLLPAFRYVDGSVFNDTISACYALCQEHGLPGLPRSLRALYDNPRHSHGFYSSEAGQSVVFDLQTLAYRSVNDDPDPYLDTLKGLPTEARMSHALGLSGPLGEFARETGKAMETLVALLRKRPGTDDESLQAALRYGVGIGKAPRAAPLASDASEVRVLRVPLVVGLKQARELAEQAAAFGDEPFLLVGDAEGFCAGIDPEELLKAVEEGDRERLEEYCQTYQRLTEALRNARCVATLHGVCAGFGLEMALACNFIVADAGTRIGMDCARYGVLPMAGGTIRLRLIDQADGAKRLADVAHMVASGKMAGNAFEAKRSGLIPSGSEIVVNPHKLEHAARAWLERVPERPEEQWLPVAGPLAGMIDQIRTNARQRGEINQHGDVLLEKTKLLLTKPTSIDSARQLETETFLDLACRTLSVARMRYTISTGKVLNN